MIILMKTHVSGYTRSDGAYVAPHEDKRQHAAEHVPQTETPEFKRWFGNSKVVDAEGKPLRVYHATFPKDGGLGDFNTFNRNAVVDVLGRRPRLDTVGSWFSTRPDEKGAGMYGNFIYPAYLSIENPYKTTFNMMARRAHQLAGTWEGFDANGRRPIPGRPGAYENAAAAVGKEQVDALRKWLKETGRDGILIQHDPRSNSTEFAEQDAWIALEPEQIKSAIGNRGTFDPNDPNITKSMPTILFLKSHVEGHYRTLPSGKRVYVNPYTDRRHAAAPSGQLALFPKPPKPESKPLDPAKVARPQDHTPDLFTGATAAEHAAAEKPREVHGLPITIENPKGGTRSKTPRSGGPTWSITMKHHYGDFDGTKGMDGDPVDVYVGDHPDASRVYVVNQQNKEGQFNEHKVLAHFPSLEAARAGYLAHYPEGWNGIQSIADMSVDEFKAWMKHGDKTKPAGSTMTEAEWEAVPPGYRGQEMVDGKERHFVIGQSDGKKRHVDISDLKPRKRYVEPKIPDFQVTPVHRGPLPKMDADGRFVRDGKPADSEAKNDHPAPIPKSILQHVPEAQRERWIDLHRRQHELHHYELGQVKEAMIRARSKKNAALGRHREAEASEKQLRSAPIRDERREAEAASYTAKTRAEFDKHAAEYGRLSYQHQSLYEQVAKLGREKESIVPGSGDMNRDFASMGLRSADEQAAHEKRMLTMYRDHYKKLTTKPKISATMRKALFVVARS